MFLILRFKPNSERFFPSFLYACQVISKTAMITITLAICEGTLKSPFRIKPPRIKVVRTILINRKTIFAACVLKSSFSYRQCLNRLTARQLTSSPGAKAENYY